MIFICFLLFVSLSITFCLKRRGLESVNRGYDFPIKEFVAPRLLNVPTNPWKGIELWSQWNHIFSLPKQTVHVLVYRCTREVTQKGKTNR